MNAHEKYILRCLELAKNGFGRTAPNPMVGAVIVCNEKIIGNGYHHKYGEPHAEVNAIQSVKDRVLLKFSTLYINLEPCIHFGKTPPCADVIIKEQIKNIVIGCIDTSPKVNGKGIEKLKNAGCNVELGILENDCRELNKRFFTYYEKNRPYIILKWAQTSDGFIAEDKHTKRINSANYSLTNISGELSRTFVHKWRTEEQAILIGTNTALNDNPQLTARLWIGKNPLRLVLDKNLHLPKNLHLFDGFAPTIVFTAVKNFPFKQNNLEYVTIDFANIIPQILDELHKREIQSVIVEGGQILLDAFIKQGIWDEARIFISPSKGDFNKGIKAPEIAGKVIYEDFIGEDKLRVISKIK